MEQQTEKRKSCILFKSIVDAAKELDKDQALELLLTYADYGLGETIDLDKCSKIVRLILMQNIEALNAADRRYQASKLNGPKGKENGGGVGRPRKGETPEEYQKRVEEWKQSKNPQETPKNPQVVSCIETPAKPQENPDNNPIKNPVIQKSALECPQNPQKPLNVDVDAEVDKDIDVDNDKDIDVENKKCTNEELRYIYINSFGEFMNNYPALNYSLIKTNNQDTFYDCYQDIVNELVIKIKNKSGRESINKMDVLLMLNEYLDYINYSYQ